jgi:hypothetical protein
MKNQTKTSTAAPAQGLYYGISTNKKHNSAPPHEGYSFFPLGPYVRAYTCYKNLIKVVAPR